MATTVKHPRYVYLRLASMQLSAVRAAFLIPVPIHLRATAFVMSAAQQEGNTRKGGQDGRGWKEKRTERNRRERRLQHVVAKSLIVLFGASV